MFYLNFLKDKYNVSYICSTRKGKNHYRIHEEPQTTLPKKHPPNIKSKRTQLLGYYLVVLLGYNFFGRPIPCGGPTTLSCLHTQDAWNKFTAYLAENKIKKALEAELQQKMVI